MATNDLIQILLYFLLLIVLTPLLGQYIYRVFTGQNLFMQRLFGRVERSVYSMIKIDPLNETGWKKYAFDLLVFNLAGVVLLFLIQIFQSQLPLNPMHFGNIPWHTAINTSISFVTNTNWQSYAGESTLGYFVQMAGLAVQNFLSAATGIAVLIALTRGLSRKSSNKIGNFWSDLTKTILYILIPLSIILAVLLTGQGVIQNFNSYQNVTTVEGGQQVLPMGPVASQVAIKQLGTNGGGFFNANSSHPFENPTPFSNFLQMLAILLIPASLTYTYGKMVGSSRQGWAVFAAMFVLLLIGFIISMNAELSAGQHLGNAALMEGKETRFGVSNSILWSTTTTAASNGSVNAMHDSLSPLAGMIAMINILTGEVVFGGVGSGLYGMVIFIILTVFISGLMVGRSPEYLGKKIESHEIKMAVVAILAPSFAILIFSAWAAISGTALSSLANAGPHGFSEILYAYGSAGGNNGSAFAGLNANTVFYNLTTGFAMLIGRFGVIVPVLAIAGSLASKKTTPVSAGTFRTDNVMFVGLLIVVILFIGGLTFFPAITLGPVAEHFLMNAGILF